MEKPGDWGAGDTSREVIQGGWGEWSSWSECCGDQKSIRNRRRVCDNPPPKGGAYCPGDDTETTPCVGCPVDGVLSQWSRWSDCSCDGIAAKSSGRATRTRVCNNVDNGGMFCMGPLADNKPCDGGC